MMRQFARNAAHFLLLQITRLSVGADRIRINVACSIETIIEGASSPSLLPILVLQFFTIAFRSVHPALEPVLNMSMQVHIQISFETTFIKIGVGLELWIWFDFNQEGIRTNMEGPGPPGTKGHQCVKDKEMPPASRYNCEGL